MAQTVTSRAQILMASAIRSSVKPNASITVKAPSHSIAFNAKKPVVIRSRKCATVVAAGNGQSAGLNIDLRG